MNEELDEKESDWLKWLQEYKKSKETLILQNDKYQKLQDFLHKKVKYFNSQYEMKRLEKSYTSEQSQKLMDLTSDFLKAKVEYESHEIHKLVETNSLDATYFQPEVIFNDYEESDNIQVLKIKYLTNKLKTQNKVGIFSRYKPNWLKLKDQTPKSAKTIGDILYGPAICLQCQNPSLKGICSCNKNDNTSFDDDFFDLSQDFKTAIKEITPNFTPCIQCQNPQFDGRCSCKDKTVSNNDDFCNLVKDIKVSLAKAEKENLSNHTFCRKCMKSYYLCGCEKVCDCKSNQ